jgi:YVTN family beta-propeller protein
MEYLMTYGWAILIIAVVLGVLFQIGVRGTNLAGNSCLAQVGFLCQKYTMNTAGVLNFTFGYIGQGTINITAIGCSSTSSFNVSSLSGAAISVSSLQSSQSEIVMAPCNLNGGSSMGAPFSGTLWVQYNQGGTIGAISQIASVRTSVSYIAPSHTSVTTTVSAGSSPRGVAYNPSNGYMYVANSGGNSVSVISGTTVVATIAVGSNPYGVAYNPSNGYMYVTNASGNSISVISGTSSTLVATIPVSLGPRDIAYNPSNGYMYVADCDSGTTVSLISGTTVVATINVGAGSYPRGVAYDPSNGDIYVTESSGTTVSVISGTSVVATVTVGNSPWGVAYNPSNGYMYVANNFNRVSLI